MKYILIVMVLFGSGGGITTVEFNSLQGCKLAGEKVTTNFKTNPYFDNVRYVCVEKY